MSDLLPSRPEPPAAGWYHDGATIRWWDGSSWGPQAPPGSFGLQLHDPIREGSTLAVLSHVGFVMAAIVLALVVRLTEGRKNEFTRHHSTEALNFQLTFLVFWMVGIFGFLGVTSASGGADGEGGGSWIVLPLLGMFVAFAAAMVLAIAGAVRASRGQWWRYPINIRFVRGARPRQ